MCGGDDDDDEGFLHVEDVIRLDCDVVIALLYISEGRRASI